MPDSLRKRHIVLLLLVLLGMITFLVRMSVAVAVGQNYAGAVTGVMSTASQAGGFICTVLFGFIAAITGSYDAPIFVVAAMVMFSAVLFVHRCQSTAEWLSLMTWL